MKEEQLRELIRRRVGKHKTQREASDAFGITEQYLSGLLRDKPITDQVAKKFGYTMKEREFEKIKEAK